MANEAVLVMGGHGAEKTVAMIATAAFVCVRNTKYLRVWWLGGVGKKALERWKRAVVEAMGRDEGCVTVVRAQDKGDRARGRRGSNELVRG